MQDAIHLVCTTQQMKHLYESCCKTLSTQYQLTKNEIDVLLFLANNAPFDTARDIVEYRAISKSHVCQSVDRLTRRGFLTGTQDEKDRRCIHLKLQPAVMPIVRQAQQMQQDFFHTLYQGVTQDELEVVKAVFQKISDNIEEASQNGR